MKKNICFLVICFIITAPVFSQTAAEIERFLATDAVIYEDAASFIIRAADIHSNSSTEAFSYAAERNWLPKKAVPEGQASLEGISLLLMQSFGMKGGFFYNLAQNPHYAYRELVYRNIIQGRVDPQMAVSGDLLLFMVNRILSFQEANQL
ncbi:MAG: hypothetical protein LBH42_00325 [Treponema sp.]|nr:hypothetical protein [Treponema sp.]